MRACRGRVNLIGEHTDYNDGFEWRHLYRADNGAISLDSAASSRWTACGARWIDYLVGVAAVSAATACEANRQRRCAYRLGIVVISCLGTGYRARLL